MEENICLGIDFGGSGIKGALVDTRSGALQSDRHRIPTPNPATPEAVAKTIRELVDHFNHRGDVGVAFPAAIMDGIVQNASNISDQWIGKDAPKLLSEATNCRVEVLNDADAAGLAEMRFGQGKNIHGVGLIVTVGVGLGTALFTDGVLLPNTELGHVYLKKKKVVAEHWASDAIRKQENLSWKQWAKRFGKYLHHLEGLFYPELIIIGGGASKKFDKYAPYLKKVKTKVIPAELQNHAGIIGAAVEAMETKQQSAGRQT
ncbi:MAG: polyphosphate--glucose phosphotransferase [Bacteroidales bacterium]